MRQKRNRFRAVIIACSAAKCATYWDDQKGARYESAGKLYTGVVWQTWRKHVVRPSLPWDWRLCALSAQHGFGYDYEKWTDYDRRLTPDRITELAPIVAEQWTTRMRHEARYWQCELGELDARAAVIGGELYQELATAAGIQVDIRIDGTTDEHGHSGIGVLRQRTRRFAEDVRRDVAEYHSTGDRCWNKWRSSTMVDEICRLSGELSDQLALANQPEEQ